MDDMNAFERQVAGEVLRASAPPRPVDAAAVFAAVTARSPRWRFQSMFSATRFVVAAVIVALFGGFLLAGVLTTQQDGEVPPAAVTEPPSPMTTEALLSGMVTEEVEPGVFRVVNDGVRDLTRLGERPYWGQHLMVDGTGGVWRIVKWGRYFRLGTEEEWALDLQPVLTFADGRLVTAPELPGVLGWGSATAAELGLDNPVLSIDVQDDGTVWLLHDGGTLVRVSPDGIPEAVDWTQAYDGAVDGPQLRLVVTPDGDVWLVGRSPTDMGPIDAFLRFDGVGWEVVPAPQEVTRVGDIAQWGLVFDLAPDGTLWTVGDAVAPHQHLARYDGSDWTILGEDDGVRPWGGHPVGAYGSAFDVVRVAPDGSVWVNAWGSDGQSCGGLGRFDGASWASFLPDTCIYDLDIAPDGAVWVVASEPPHVFRHHDGMEVVDLQTYAITPEALVAKEAEVTEPPPVEEASDAEEASTTADLLSGMVAEEVEPGVYRVVNDGVRDLTSIDEAVDIVTGYDHGIWLLRGDGFYRLGSDASHGWPAEVNGWPVDISPYDHLFEVAPDGTMWVIRASAGLHSIDGEEWAVQPCPEDSTACMGFTVAPDGSVWASWTDERGASGVGRLGPTGWEPLDGSIPPGWSLFARLFFTDAGGLYGKVCDWGCWLHRYEDGEWQEQATASRFVDVGSDGTVWKDEEEGLARFADGEWTEWTSADLPDIRFDTSGGLDQQFRVDPDGSLWFSLWRSADGRDSRLGEDSWECDGLTRFDGETLDRFMPGQCISAMDITADGSVWVLTSETAVWVGDDHDWVLPDDQTWDLYVITPEAVAGTS